MRSCQKHSCVHWYPDGGCRPLEEKDIDRTEAKLFRQINGLPNIISNKAIMNVACSMRNAWEIVDSLARRACL